VSQTDKYLTIGLLIGLALPPIGKALGTLIAMAAIAAFGL